MTKKDLLLGKIRSGAPLTSRQQLSLCLLLSYPAIIAQLSSVLMQYIDTAMVGHLGAAAGAAIGLVSTCMWLLGGFCMAATSGFSVQVAHRIGANDFAGARDILRQGLLCALLFSVAIALAGAAVSGPLPRWLGGGKDICGDASRYFLLVSLFIPAMQIDWMCAAMLQASGEMRIPSLLNINMCLLDVAFNYLFIYVLDMGVTGAALGTGLAEVITALLMLYFLSVRSPELNLRQERGSFRPTRPVLGKAWGISGPMALQNILMRGAYIASTVIVAPLGTIAIAANSFAVTAESFCYMPGYGIADAATTLVGQSVGAGRKPLATRFAWTTTLLGMAVMTFLAGIMYAFAPGIMGMLTPDGEVVRLGSEVLRIEAFAETGYAASIVAYGAFVGAGDTRWPSVMNFGSMWVVRILPAIFLTRIYGLKGVWLAMAVELTSSPFTYRSRVVISCFPATPGVFTLVKMDIRGLDTHPAQRFRRIVVRALRRVVVAAQVAEEQVLQRRVPEGADGFGAGVVAQVAVSLADPHLEFVGIIPAQEHVHVEIGLHHDRVRRFREGHRLGRDVAEIRHQHEAVPFRPDGIAHRLGRIMGNDKILDRKTFRHFIPAVRREVVAAESQIVGRETVVQERILEDRRREDRQGKPLAQRAEMADMVEMVMGDENPAETVRAQPQRIQFPAEAAEAHARIDQDAVRKRQRIIGDPQEQRTVSAAAGREADKTDHRFCSSAQ